jgi:hypothetical protein
VEGSNEITVDPDSSAYNALKALRVQYAIVYIGILLLTMGSGFVISIVLRYLGIIASGSKFPRVAIWGLILVASVSIALWNYLYSMKVGRNPLLPTILGLIPVLRWIGFFMIVGYTPKEFASLEYSQEPLPIVAIVLLLISGFIPFMGLLCLTAIRPEYMGQLYSGPPQGAYIPGLPVPCGWPILGFIVLVIALVDLPIWLGFRQRLVRGGWGNLLILLVFIFFIGPACYLVLLGPATIQLYKAFFS